MPRLGIDFGTTNSMIVAYDKEKNSFEYFSYEDGRIAPVSSTVWYHDENIVVGTEARDKINSFSDVDGHHFEKSIKLTLGLNKSINIFGREVQPYKVAADIIKHLKHKAIYEHDAENLGIIVDKAVFTVPVKFSGKQRRELRKAANEAGIEVITFIHEPFAAIVGYYFTHTKASSANEIIENLEKLDGKYLLTFDWGGGTLDVTVVKVENGKMKELGTAELSGLAGDKFDEDIALWAWNKFLENNKQRYNNEFLEKIRKDKWDRLLSIAEQCKIKLSNEQSADFLIESLIPGDLESGINEIITRHDFELMIQNVVDKAINSIDDALDSARIGEINISHVFLTGGSCYIPYVQDQMKKKFSHRVETVNNAELLIAQGAAVIAEMKWVPFLTKDILIELSDGSFWTFFEKETLIVYSDENSRSEIFTCIDQRNKNAKVIVCEGIQQEKHKNLAILNVPILNDKHFGDDIKIEGNIDRDIILTIKAHSLLVNGYKQFRHSGVDEEYSIRKNVEITQLCFGLDFKD